jgi:hypothetical protein
MTRSLDKKSFELRYFISKDLNILGIENYIENFWYLEFCN